MLCYYFYDSCGPPYIGSYLSQPEVKKWSIVVDKLQFCIRGMKSLKVIYSSALNSFLL